MITKDAFLKKLEEKYGTMDVQNTEIPGSSKPRYSTKFDKIPNVIVEGVYLFSWDGSQDVDRLIHVHVSGTTNFEKYIVKLDGFRDWMALKALDKYGKVYCTPRCFLDLPHNEITSHIPINETGSLEHVYKRVREIIRAVHDADRELSEVGERILNNSEEPQTPINYGNTLIHIQCEAD